MTQEELQKLKALAQAATPGPWSYNGNCRFGVWQNEGKFYVFESSGHDDASYTAAANPATILVMIERIESLTADAKRLEMVTRDNSKITELQHGVWAFEYRENMRMSSTHGATPRGAIDAAIAKEKANE